MLDSGSNAGMVFHNTYGEIYSVVWIFLYILLIGGIQRFMLVERTRHAFQRFSSFPGTVKNKIVDKFRRFADRSGSWTLASLLASRIILEKARLACHKIVFIMRCFKKRRGCGVRYHVTAILWLVPQFPYAIVISSWPLPQTVEANCNRSRW